MEAFVVFITLIGSVLNIILFFKVWGMTNNVVTVKNLLKTEFNSEFDPCYFHSLIALGDKDKAKEHLLHSYALRLIEVSAYYTSVDARKDMMLSESKSFEKYFKELDLEIPQDMIERAANLNLK